MYSEFYLHLKTRYNYNNFEVIAGVLEDHFGDLFKLDVLNYLFDPENPERTNQTGSYATFFDLCMRELQDNCYTPGEVISKINALLESENVRKHVLEHYVFVPPSNGKPNAQIGFFENFVSGHLPTDPPETPLSYLDMVRAVGFFQRANARITYGVYHIGNLKQADLANKKILYVNFAQDVTKMPKWGVVDLRDPSAPSVYCEAPLSEQEKGALQEAINSGTKPTYLGGKADFSVSTGYLALAYGNQCIDQHCGLTLTSDFSALLDEFIWVLTQKQLKLMPGADEEHYYDETFVCCLADSGLNVKSANLGSAIWGMAQASLLGELDPEQPYRINDLRSGVEILARKGLYRSDPEHKAEKQREASKRSFVLGLDAALRKMGILVEHDNTVQLNIPEEISQKELESQFAIDAKKYSVGVIWVNHVRRYENLNKRLYDQEDMATAMVLTTIRGCARQPKLVIHLPTIFSLNKEEQRLIYKFMIENPYVTELVNGSGNLTLQHVLDDLVPTFARNRWLNINGYRPPMADDYWKQAAKFWLWYLPKNQDVLLAKESHEEFKRCVLEMGLKGLEEVLKFLNDPAQRTLLDNVYGNKTPAFYAACVPAETGEYLDKLITHLEGNGYFPYSELGIAYQPGFDGDYFQLLHKLNQLRSESSVARFNKITLTRCLTDMAAFKSFLKNLIVQASDDDTWIASIVIPELENKDNVTEEHRELRDLYSLLNDVISRNRNKEAGKTLLQDIKKASRFDVVIPDADMPAAIVNAAGDVPIGEFDRKIQENMRIIPTDGFPWQRGGETALQMQQQMQIEQERTVNQKHETRRTRIIDEALVGDLVSYETIDALLGDFLNRFAQENPIYDRCAQLKEANESLLQGFFHTWVSANPTVEARSVFRFMTQDAAKALLVKHPFLGSGLNPDNLPKDFFTMYTTEGHLVLCYNPEVGHVTDPKHPLKLDLSFAALVSDHWDGSFRTLNLPRYLVENPPLDAEDWQNISLFAQLQPLKHDYSFEFDAFCEKNPGLASVMRQNEQKIKQFWTVFVQVWQYKGEAGIQQFLKKPENELYLPVSLIRERLFARQAADLREWVNTVPMSEEYLRAIGQVYGRLGHEAVMLLLRKFQQIATLGAPAGQFFADFNQKVLARCSNFNEFMTTSFFETMDNMIEKLCPATAQGDLLVWKDIVEKHMESVGWDSIEKLWRGFVYFQKELQQMGLRLTGDEFKQVPPENMLVAMDRILQCLHDIPQQTEQENFLKKLHRLDRTHGGVPYALHYEGFTHIDADLELHDFVYGTPTYAPDIKELYNWPVNDWACLQMKRVLASQARFSADDYKILSAPEHLGSKQLVARHRLMWLLYTQYLGSDLVAHLQTLSHIDPAYLEAIGRHLFLAVNINGNLRIAVNFDVLLELEKLIQAHPNLSIQSVMDCYPNGTFLEAMTILSQANRWSSAPDLIQLLAQRIAKPRPGYPDFLWNEGYKIAALFGVYDVALLQQFHQVTTGIYPIVELELRALMAQLYSINYNTSISKLEPKHWDALLKCIADMQEYPHQTGLFRLQFIDFLDREGVKFKYSKGGEFRALLADKTTEAPRLDLFTDHHERIWLFLKQHILVPVEGDSKTALEPIVRFLERLQLNRTYLNEVEPLLASLEATEDERYWSASYFYGLLKALSPVDEKTSFPITLLKVLLKNELVAAKALDSVQKDFPIELHDTLQGIVNNSKFDRNQQAILCNIALQEAAAKGNGELSNKIMNTLSQDLYQTSRGYALEILAKNENFDELENRFESCCWLLQLPNTIPQWGKTSAIWLKAICDRECEARLLEQIQHQYSSDVHKQALILHILAWSTLKPGLRDDESYQYELDKKAPKLLQRLGQRLSKEQLEELANCYPKEPSPGADDILRLLKWHGDAENDKSWGECLESFKRNPYPEPRGDYRAVSVTREADLQRMLANTQISRGKDRDVLPVEDTARLTLIFSYVKQYEAGTECVDDYNKPIAEMDQEELAEAFYRLSGRSITETNNDRLYAQIWAVLFEVLGRTTRKYPHLAQQFALIANDICVNADTRVLQLATGEGKSHFVAMRAVRNAGLRKVVDVCTAKRDLAERDLREYQGLFDYLGIKTAYIHPSKSSREQYIGSQVHYTTMGDLSLFLDEQNFRGQPILIDQRHRVGLFDEFDFIRFEEGRKTEYNYATPTGKTPKQMTWFYQAVNQFYKLCVERELAGLGKTITRELIMQFGLYLREIAGENEEQFGLIKGMLLDPMQLVQWLQSAEEAHALKQSVHFTVLNDVIKVGVEEYPMREIVPLSSDSQKMIGSTFSAGVHQLLAVRLNTEAMAKGEPQDHHIHPQSHIISSRVAVQRIQELWSTWEGFTGTISPAQATTLHNDHNTQVLHVPTNQSDLRTWNTPIFSEGKHGDIHEAIQNRYVALVRQIRICFSKKQSILFACKDDAQVAELERELKLRLTPEEFAQFIFYTNESTLSSREVLNHKKNLEQRLGGKNQKGAALVASGFGRGDNVEVQAVFLLTVTDVNDQLQKGGRTARNGEDGEVFQFYLKQDIDDKIFEQKAALLRVIPQEEYSMLENVITKYQEANDYNNLFTLVMLIGEYTFSLQNEAKQGYHNAIAQFSKWGMACLSAVVDETERGRLILNFSARITQLEKLWIDISCHPGKTAEDKIDAVKRAVDDVVVEFSRTFDTELRANTGSIPRFELVNLTASKVHLIIPRKPPKPTAQDQAMATICNALAGLPGLFSEEYAHEIPKLLAILSGEREAMVEDGASDGEELADEFEPQGNLIMDSFADEEDVHRSGSLGVDAEERDESKRQRCLYALQKFAKTVDKHQDATQFVKELKHAVDDLVKPSEPWEKMVDETMRDYSPDMFLHYAPPELAVEFVRVGDALGSKLKTHLLTVLCTPSIWSSEKRVERALPILKHLLNFKDEDRVRWAADYIEHINTIIDETSPDLLQARLENTPPMSYADFDSIWKVARTYTERDDVYSDFSVLSGQALKRSPEQRLRMLGRWERWSAGMEATKAQAFLQHFCRVMAQFQEGKDWDTFGTLVKKTQDWWSKVGNRNYQNELTLLWARLSERAEALPELNDFIKWCVAPFDAERGQVVAGKSWFQLLSICLTLPKAALIAHQNHIKKMWEDLNATGARKNNNTKIFADSITTLLKIYAFINQEGRYESDMSDYCKDMLQTLSYDDCLSVMAHFSQYEALFTASPTLFSQLLRFVDEGRPAARISFILGWLSQVNGFEKKHSVAHLLSEGTMSAFMNLEALEDYQDILKDFVELLAEYPHIFNEIMRAMEQKCTPMQIRDTLTLLATIIEKQRIESFDKDKIAHLLSEAFINDVLTYTTAQYNAMQQCICDNFPLLLGYPLVFQKVSQYLKESGYHVRTLCQLLSTVANCKVDNIKILLTGEWLDRLTKISILDLDALLSGKILPYAENFSVFESLFKQMEEGCFDGYKIDKWNMLFLMLLDIRQRTQQNIDHFLTDNNIRALLRDVRYSKYIDYIMKHINLYVTSPKLFADVVDHIPVSTPKHLKKLSLLLKYVTEKQKHKNIPDTAVAHLVSHDFMTDYMRCVVTRTPRFQTLMEQHFDLFVDKPKVFETVRRFMLDAFYPEGRIVEFCNTLEQVNACGSGDVTPFFKPQTMDTIMSLHESQSAFMQAHIKRHLAFYATHSEVFESVLKYMQQNTIAIRRFEDWDALLQTLCALQDQGQDISHFLTDGCIKTLLTLPGDDNRSHALLEIFRNGAKMYVESKDLFSGMLEQMQNHETRRLQTLDEILHFVLSHKPKSNDLMARLQETSLMTRLLNLPYFILRMELLRIHIAAFSDRPDMLLTVLTVLERTDISYPRVRSLMAVLADVIQSKDSALEPLLAEGFITNVLFLSSDEQFGSMLQILLRSMRLFAAHPELLQYVLHFIKTRPPSRRIVQLYEALADLLLQENVSPYFFKNINLAENILDAADDEKFNYLLHVMLRNAVAYSAHTDVFHDLVRMARYNGIPTQRFVELNAQIIRIFALKGENAHLLAPITLDRILNLVDKRRFECMMRVMEEFLPLLSEYPELLTVLLTDLEDVHGVPERSLALCQTLKNIVLYQNGETLHLRSADTLLRLLRLTRQVHFEYILALMKDQVAIFSAHPELFEVMLCYMEFPANDIRRARSLSIVMQNAHRFQAMGNALHLLRPEFLRGILYGNISDERFDLWCEVVNDDIAILSESLEIYHAILCYITNEELEYANVELIIRVLLAVARYQKANPSHKTEHLLSDVDHFKDNLPALEALFDLTTKEASYHNAQLPELLSNDSPNVIGDTQTRRFHQQMGEVTTAFHRALKAGKTTAADMMQDPVVSEWFTFARNRTDGLHVRRMLFMKMLNERAFVTVGKSSEHVWTEDNNNELLRLGFAKYVAATEAILKTPSSSEKRQRTRDLSIPQQHELLRLTDEMHIIGQARVALQPEHEAGKTLLLTQQLQALMTGYSNRWFKSKTRDMQLNSLKADIATSLQGNPDQCRYEAVLQALFQAKCAAMESDLKKNDTRWGLFKVNRNGSRYYETLNKMQDLVLRHWAADMNHIQRIQVFQTYCKHEFMELADLLLRAVSQHHKEKYPESRRGNEKGFFGQGRRERRVQLEDVMQGLHEFAAQTEEHEMQSDDVSRLMRVLKERISKLPGHVATVARELIARGDALASHLAEQEKALDLDGVSPMGGVYHQAISVGG